MPELSQFSLDNLESCHPDLIRVFVRVAEITNIRITDGHRSKLEQQKAYDSCHSKMQWPDSGHNKTPSIAIDVAPYPIDWDDKRRFYYLAGMVKAVAEEMGIKIRFGGDWSGDGIFKDQKFDDLVHYELDPLYYRDA